MNEEMRKKYQRLIDRVNELDKLNTNIAKLAFYLNENEIECEDEVETEDCNMLLCSQLDAMMKYRDALQDRIVCGYY